ncbi:hypothetical protein V7157_27990 [Neobacillus drentensis]|uniref:hypothetical protein n=1 Tax=Neobacillus TaxID=2675232 RepID=UPI0030019EEF
MDAKVIVLIIILLCVLFTWFVNRLKKRSKEKEFEKKQNKIRSILDEHQFTVLRRFSTPNDYHHIFYDDENKRILTIHLSEPEKTELINTNKIIHCELFEDESSIIKSSRGPQIGGAIVGGIIGGSTGAIIGGLSGESKQTGAARIIELRITVDEILKPLFKFLFLHRYTPIEKTSTEYQKAMNEALEWQSLVAVLMYRNRNEQ